MALQNHRAGGPLLVGRHRIGILVHGVFQVVDAGFELGHFVFFIGQLLPERGYFAGLLLLGGFELREARLPGLAGGQGEGHQP